MYYSPANSYMWDFWLVKKKDLYHIYYLQAPRSIQNPDIRHSVASVGHAVSKDLEIWKEDGTVLEAGTEESWDDTSIWTGSIIEKNEKYYMFYTSRSKVEAGKIQRIGVAISEDLYVWEKYKNNPVMEADANWYEKADISDEGLEHWRDPFIIYNREDKFYYAFICARVNYGDYNGRGCIARAKSRDLLVWEVMSPATDAGNFYEMEVPDLHFKNGRWYLLFTTSSAAYSEKHKKEIFPLVPQTGTLYYQSKTLLGKFTPMANQEVLLGTETQTYAARVIEDMHGDNVVLTWKIKAEGFDGFAGCLDRPRRLKYMPDGTLKL